MSQNNSTSKNVDIEDSMATKPYSTSPTHNQKQQQTPYNFNNKTTSTKVINAATNITMETTMTTTYTSSSNGH